MEEITRLVTQLEDCKIAYSLLHAEVLRLNKVLENVFGRNSVQMIKDQDREIRWLRTLLFVRDPHRSERDTHGVIQNDSVL